MRSSFIVTQLFMITVPGAEIEAAYKVTDICGMRVTVTLFKSRKGPPQCHHYRRFVQSSECCTLARGCLRCSGSRAVSTGTLEK
ncbi:hypothetical protein Trydic_g19911 [Trypoxylus dichotomus]